MLHIAAIRKVFFSKVSGFGSNFDLNNALRERLIVSSNF
jgi:hypothetical protein